MNSNSGEQVISVELSITTQTFSCAFETYFDIEETCRIINENEYKRIALQFPDALLQYAPQVSTAISSNTNASTYILADTSYGSCCVDEVASQHVNADLIVHYGESCLSRRSGVPVIYVYGCGDINTESVVEFCQVALSEVKKEVLMIHFDVEYYHALAEIKSKLEIIGFEVRYDELTIFDRGDASVSGSCACKEVESITAPMKQLEISQEGLVTILYIGKRGPHLSHVLLLNSQSTFFTYDPSELSSTDTSAVSPKILLRSRYAKISAAVTSQTIGIIVGTLGLSSYLPLIESLKKLVRRKGKGVYVMAVGKVNPEKLGNFGEVGCWVFVGCGVRGMMLEGEGKGYHRSVLTPFELVVGLESVPDKGCEEGEQKSIGWAPGADGALGKYEMDFGIVAARLKRMVDNQSLSVEERGLVSMNGMKDVTAYVSAIEFLNSRTFRGLDVQKGVNEPSAIEKGRSGLARDYSEA